MGDSAVLLEKCDSIGWLVLNQPDKRNALSQAMWATIPELLSRAEKDKEILTLVIRGSNELAFASGADISEFSTVHATAQSSQKYNRIVHEAERCLSLFPKPTIAMIQGPCVGGGCGLALACDLRFADTTALFAIPPSNLGLVYSLQGTKLLMDKVGPGLTRDMLYSGRKVTAKEAFHSGLIERLEEPSNIRRVTEDYCNELSKRSQFSINATKKIVQKILDGVTADTPETLELFDSAFQGEDYQEGTAAFLQKRDPNFTWR